MNAFVSGWLAGCFFANGNLTKHDLQSSLHHQNRLLVFLNVSLQQAGEFEIHQARPSAKSFLDLPRTLEYLETLSVPVLGLGCDFFPEFTVEHGDLKIPARVETIKELAEIVRANDALGRNGGILACVPVPKKDGLLKSFMDEITATDAALFCCFCHAFRLFDRSHALPLFSAISPVRLCGKYPETLFVFARQTACCQP